MHEAMTPAFEKKNPIVEQTPFRDDRAAASTGVYVFITNKEGKWIGDESFDGAHEPSEGTVCVYRAKDLDKKYLIEETGASSKAKHPTLERVYKKEYFFVNSDNAKRCFDPELVFDTAEPFFNGKAVVTKGKDMYFLHKDGTLERLNVDSSDEDERSAEEAKVLEWRKGMEEEYGDGFRESEVRISLTGVNVDDIGFHFREPSNADWETVAERVRRANMERRIGSFEYSQKNDDSPFRLNVEGGLRYGEGFEAALEKSGGSITRIGSAESRDRYERIILNLPPETGIREVADGGVAIDLRGSGKKFVLYPKSSLGADDARIEEMVG